ncbi:helix-turn-helix domain-containing protein [Saccharopolyspora phatthalungensis]|uniref:GAF domain-containing protein n=1 Tax=Saccharopolyspora phatthalungensis TaxID=664693 RepID=A0A840QHW2_9PSEU|nr:helix-turn-helix domain-containing protein [Saccharopolyspora phatthalungensis]MBB5159630.1 GAF domain-containing protein [Saccharopolyspora phatthalungensis]
MVGNADDRDPVLPVPQVVELLDAAAADSGDAAADALEKLGAQLPAEQAAALTNRVRNLRAVLARWRRRGQELSALFSSARELAELRDTDALLHRLVERAHDLMGTDITYLSEFHEGSDELHVRSTLGTVAPSFRALRVPPGMGLASKVVRTRCPQWASVYQATDSIPHEPGIDAAVAAEGLVSLLGVPLVAGERVLGVLFAANRSKHEFVPEEIALLSAFADHAAVVLQTTRLLEQARVAAQEAERANSVLASNVTAMERASAVHEDLTAVVLQGGHANGVAETLSKALDRPVVILDRELVPVTQEPVAGGVRYSAPDGALLPEVRDAIEASRQSGRCVFVDGSSPSPEVAVAVVASETLLGAVLVGYGDLELREVEQRTIERAAQITALVAVKQEAVAAAEDRVRGELVSDILRGDASRWQELLLRARAREVRLEELRSVVIVAVSPDRRGPAFEALRRAVAGGLVGERDGMLTVLAPSPDPMTAAREVWQAVRRAQREPVLVVAGPPARSAAELGQCFESARRCVQLLSNLNTVEGTVDAQAYEPYMAMFGPGGKELSGFIAATIGPVLRWDQERGTQLFETLRVFADSYASPTRTARVLHVHINTVTQRLERISALLDANWREPEPLFRISVAARLHALARDTAAG